MPGEGLLLKPPLTRLAPSALGTLSPLRGARVTELAATPRTLDKLVLGYARRRCYHSHREADMKAIFIDCNDQLDQVFARVHRTDDPPITVNTRPVPAADLPRLIDGYAICLDDHSYMPTDVVAQCRTLKHIVFLGTGAASYMDVPALNGLGVTVHTIKGYGDTAVAEHAIALMFACCREVARMDRAVRAGVWDPLESMQLKGKTLGLIGLGGIGAEVARIAGGIGMEVIGWNRSPRPQAGVAMVALDELLARADVI